MKKTIPTSTCVAILLAGVAVVGVMASTAWAGPQQVAAEGFVWKDGQEVYTKVCALCHETKVGPTLRGRDLDPIYIQLIVRNGSRAMPAFRSSEIDDQLLEKLAAYISNTAATK